MEQRTTLEVIPKGNGNATPSNLSPMMAYHVSPLEIKAQVGLIQQVLSDVMIEGEHYGKVPGCGDKNVLLKPGAEKIGMVFRIMPQFELFETWHPDGHYTVRVKCRLVHAPTGQTVGEGDGICSTREKKYAYRNGQLKCPECGKETVLKSKPEKGDGWFCWQKKGGCGMTFGPEDTSISGQEVGRVANDCLADCYNTVLKMADKRAHVAAILTATAASDIFTQDLEDHQEDFQNFREANSRPATPPPQAEKAAPPPQPQPEPAAPAKTASSESPLGDGKNAFITAAQIEALYRVSQDLKFKPSDWPAIVKNTLGMKIESTVKMTRTQFQTLGGLIKKVQSGGGEVTFDRAALRFVVPPAMPRDPGQEG